jgi:hypothetical protein
MRPACMSFFPLQMAASLVLGLFMDAISGSQINLKQSWERRVPHRYFDSGAVRVSKRWTHSLRSVALTSDTAQNWKPPRDQRIRLYPYRGSMVCVELDPAASGHTNTLMKCFRR